MHDSLLGYITNTGGMQLTCLRVKMYVFPESYILVHSVKTSLLYKHPHWLNIFNQNVISD